MRRIGLSLVAILSAVSCVDAGRISGIRRTDPPNTGTFQDGYNITIASNSTNVGNPDDPPGVIDVGTGTAINDIPATLRFDESFGTQGGSGWGDHFFAITTTDLGGETDTFYYDVALRLDQTGTIALNTIRFELWENTGTLSVPSVAGASILPNNQADYLTDGNPVFRTDDSVLNDFPIGTGPSATGYTRTLWNGNTLEFQLNSGATGVTNANPVTFNFRIFVPHNFADGGSTNFILRMFTTVPEASSFALGGLALASIIPAGVASRMRKRKLTKAETAPAAA